MAIRNSTGANTGYIYGDGGTAHKVGESSQKLNQVLAPDGSSPLVTFIAFPGSGSGREVGKSPETKIGPMVLLQDPQALTDFQWFGVTGPRSVGSEYATPQEDER